MLQAQRAPGVSWDQERPEDELFGIGNGRSANRIVMREKMRRC